VLQRGKVEHSAEKWMRAGFLILQRGHVPAAPTSNHQKQNRELARQLDVQRPMAPDIPVLVYPSRFERTGRRITQGGIPVSPLIIWARL